jgi:hypothetical protein
MAAACGIGTCHSCRNEDPIDRYPHRSCQTIATDTIEDGETSPKALATKKYSGQFSVRVYRREHLLLISQPADGVQQSDFRKWTALDSGGEPWPLSTPTDALFCPPPAR